MSVDVLLVSATPLPGLDLDAERVRRRAMSLARFGGGHLLAPITAAGPLMETGVRHLAVPSPPGASLDDRIAAVAQQLEVELGRLRPRVVHCFGVHLAGPALLQAWKGTQVIIEPGLTAAQRLRDADERLSAARIADLVALEDRGLARATALVARSPTEAATLVRRGVSPADIWTVRDGPMPGEPSPPSGMPHLVFVGHLGPRSGWGLLLEALARLERPWRATLVIGDGPRGAVEKRARALRIDARLSLARLDDGAATRVAAARVVVCPAEPGRGLVSGGWTPQGILWAVGAARPLVAPDLPAIRAYAGAGARYYEPGDAGALARALEALLGDPAAIERLAAAARDWRARVTWEDADGAVRALWGGVRGAR